MPFIRVTTPAGLLNDDEREEIAEVLTVEIMRIETGGLDTPEYRAISTLVFEEIATGSWASGGRIITEPAVLVEVRVPAGAVDEHRRERIAQAASRVLRNASAALSQANEITRIWSHVIEITEGNWGAGGRAVGFSDIRRIAAGRLPGGMAS